MPLLPLLAFCVSSGACERLGKTARERDREREREEKRDTERRETDRQTNRDRQRETEADSDKRKTDRQTDRMPACGCFRFGPNTLVLSACSEPRCASIYRDWILGTGLDELQISHPALEFE